MILAQKLKSSRISHRLSQKTLAETLGVSRATVSLWESGQTVPPVQYLRRYQELFDFEKGYFDVGNSGFSKDENCSFDVSLLNSFGVRELEKFYNSLTKRKECLKKP